MVILGTIGIVCFTIAVGIVLDKKYGILPRPEKLDPPKQNPRGIIYGFDHPGGAVPRDRLPSECPKCHVAYELTPDDERIRYNDMELQLVRAHCPKCDARRTLYVRPDR